MHGQDQNFDSGVPLSDHVDGFQTVQLRHRQIENHQVAVHPVKHIQELGAVRRFADNFKICDSRDQLPQTRAKDRVIVCDHYARRFQSSFSFFYLL